MSKAHPELFSETNMKRIAKGKAPRVDDTFLEYFPQYKGYKNKKLVHHHVGGGGQAMPIPVNLHKGFGIVHNVEKLWDIWGGVDKDVFSGMLENIKSLTPPTKNWNKVK